MLLHVSILRSSSGSVHCSLLKLYVKMLISLLYLSVMQQHIVCMCIYFNPCREVVRQSRTTSLQGIQHLHIHTIQYNNITVHSLMCNKLSQKFLFEDILYFYNYNIFFLTFSCVFYKHRKNKKKIHK
jgi:hypothetical protein